MHSVEEYLHLFALSHKSKKIDSFYVLSKQQKDLTHKYSLLAYLYFGSGKKNTYKSNAWIKRSELFTCIVADYYIGKKPYRCELSFASTQNELKDIKNAVYLLQEQLHK